MSRVSKHRNMSLIGWNTIYQLKICEGLGLKNMEIMNRALIMKLVWGLIFSLNSPQLDLWSKVLYTKYGLGNSTPPHVLPTHNGSHMRKVIVNVWPDTLKGIRWNIVYGRRVRFW